MAIVDTPQLSVWEALAGRAPGQPLGPADPGLWSAVAERVNPAKAKPVLRPGIETADLVSARGVAYSMLRSPDGKQACYLRLAPEEVELTTFMDGSRTLARLVAEFARISGRLAPDQVRRIVADLAGNRMLEELPVDAFAPLQRVRRRPWPLRLGRGLLAFAQGRRMVLANVDPVVGFLYRAGGRLLFTRVAAALLGTVAVLGLGAFAYQWWTGEQSVFLTSNSYATGALVLLGLNILALACHELGHALATKHAGRRVPAAGFLVYFGIPSVFVDTTDVWMAGRRARLLTTAAGPSAGLILAGASALVGFAVPEAAPWCFKLSFAWYINAMFNLNPFLALDGYYLLMDWLEVPNLRARGLAWVVARVRRRPPSWSGLDREGRLVALYGLLAVGWLVVAANIAYRVYVDRVGGLITGLWRAGWSARVLLVVVIAALMSPVMYILCSWVAKRWRRFWQRVSERKVEKDLPRRVAALRASSLRDLPAETLASLAAGSRWVYPRTGEQIVLAGAAQPDVFAVVEGALEGRAPGDPGGTVRERVGAGGVVGLGPAISGSPSPLAWYTAGTKLLAMPSPAVAAAVGALSGPPGGNYGTSGEAEQLFCESPALTSLSYEDRLGLAAAAVPIALAPNGPVVLDSGDAALLVSAGVILSPDGQELGRGTLIGPTGDDFNGTVATARTQVRLFRLPAVSGLPLLLGASAGRLADEAAGREPGRPPITGVHPIQAYAPLAVPPGPPPPTVDESVDGRFEKRLRWLLILILLLALLFTGGNVLLGVNAWAEMPSDRALVQIQAGTGTAVVDGVAYALSTGDDIYVGETDQVTVDQRSLALMTYRGGATSVLCATTQLVVGKLISGGLPLVPTAKYQLRRGLAINDTATGSPAFADLDLSVRNAANTTHNKGAAFFAVGSAGTQVATGEVFVGAVRQAAPGGNLACGDGTIVTPRPSGSPSGSPSPRPSPTASASPSDSPSPSPSETPSSTTSTTRRPTTNPPPPPTTTQAPPPDVQPPSVQGAKPDAGIVDAQNSGQTCSKNATSTKVHVFVADPDTPLAQLTVTVRSNIVRSDGVQFQGPSGTATFVQGNQYDFVWGPVAHNQNYRYQSTVDIIVTVSDPAGNTSRPTPFVQLFQFLDCQNG